MLIVTVHSFNMAKSHQWLRNPRSHTMLRISAASGQVLWHVDVQLSTETGNLSCVKVGLSLW